MQLKHRVALDGIELDSIDDRIMIQKVETADGKESVSTVDLFGVGSGSRVTSIHRSTLDVTVKFTIRLRKTEDEAGGGSLPNVSLPGYAAAIVPKGRSVDALEEALRLSETCIVSRIHEGELLLSARTLLPGDEERIAAAVAAL